MPPISIGPAGIGSRIEHLRAARCLSQEDLAKKLRTHKNVIGKWERGRACPDMWALVDLSLLFSITIDWLLGMQDIRTDGGERAIQREVQQRIVPGALRVRDAAGRVQQEAQV